MDEKFEQEEMSVADLRFNLSYYGADYPIDSLVKRMESADFIFPNFQRQYVWKLYEGSRFIESLLLGLPVPSIFLARDKYSNKLIVIDGQQRLKTLQFFYQGHFPDGKPFRLRNVIPQLSGMNYNNLNSEDRFTLDNTIIHCLIISENEKSDSIFYLFERLNTTGTPLTNQEIRNAIYHGSFNDLLNDLSKSEIWKKLYHKDEIRLEDQELILRFISLATEFEYYSGNLNEFLNSFMHQNKDFERISKNEIEEIFFKTLNIIFEALGENAFYHNKLFNRSLFETLSIIIARSNNLSNKQVDLFYKELVSNDSFWQLCKSATTNRRTFVTRIEFAQHILESIEL